MTIKPSLTQEQRREFDTFEKAEEYAAGSRISFIWMQSDPWGSIFPMCKHNAQILGKWITEHRGGDWTLEALDAAAEATHTQWLAEDPKEPVTEPPPPAPSKRPTLEELFGPWAALTKSQVIKMTGKQMSQANRDPRFTAKVNSLGITKADISAKE